MSSSSAPNVGSIVIPHYGDPQPTLTLIESLLPQLGTAWEIIVADDHSPQPFPEAHGVRVVRRDANGGFGKNCNTGAAEARGELLLFLNSDLEVGPTFLADLVAAAAPWQPCVAGPRMLDHAGRDSFSARHFPKPSHQIVEWLVPLAGLRHLPALHTAVGHDMDAHRATSALPVDWLVGAVLLLPRAEFDAVGGFDERFFMNAEEIDLQRRLRDRGIPRVFLPTVTVTHEGGGSSASERRRQWLVDGRWRYAGKWGGTRRLKAGLSAATLVNLLWGLARRVAGRPIHPWADARTEWQLIWPRKGRQRQP
ncbi:MAG: glycosyltransferase family 2 protein [Propionibacteriaceae bacterium]|nr:glycosyltransferase family 2 protein [Propionibacteriaceae bacterium]